MQCYVKGDRESLPMNLKLIEITTIICYLRSYCEVKAETLLEDKPDKNWTISFCFKHADTHTYTHRHKNYSNDNYDDILFHPAIPLAVLRIRVFILFLGSPIDHYIHDLLCVFKILDPSFYTCGLCMTLTFNADLRRFEE